MKKYIGIKVVNAKPMTRLEYNQLRGWELPADEDGNDLGFYKDDGEGHIQWDPIDVFERDFTPVEGMTFGIAIEAMKKGMKVRMVSWSPEVYLSLQKPDTNSKMTHPYIYVTSRFGLVPWVATQVEMLSDSWMIVD